MHEKTKAYIELHLAVLLFGFTAILGDLIQLSSLILVWWRVLIASIGLFFFIKNKKVLFRMPKSLVITYSLIGLLVGLHWVTFFGAIKLANASVCLICMATTAFFTAIMEPLILRKDFIKLDILLGMAIIPGMILVVSGIDSYMIWGVLSGLLSALLAAAFSILNKKYITQATPVPITFIELFSAWIFLGIVVFLYSFNKETIQYIPSKMDWLYLCILGLLCTSVGYLLELKSLVHISAFASTLTMNLEPIYGILLAIIILKENQELSFSFYVGVIVILISVFSYPWLKRRNFLM